MDPENIFFDKTFFSLPRVLVSIKLSRSRKLGKPTVRHACASVRLKLYIPVFIWTRLPNKQTNLRKPKKTALNFRLDSKGSGYIRISSARLNSVVSPAAKRSRLQTISSSGKVTSSQSHGSYPLRCITPNCHYSPAPTLPGLHLVYPSRSSSDAKNRTTPSFPHC